MHRLILRLGVVFLVSTGFVCTFAIAGHTQVTSHAMEACESLLFSDEETPVERRRRVIMTYVVFLERQGREAPEPEYTVEKDTCIADLIDVDGKQVLMTSAGFNEGLQTLHYRMVFKDGEDVRSVLVLYNGMVSAVFEGDYFFVSETRGPSTAFYEVYKAQPGHEELKELATGIVRGTATPLITTEFRDEDWKMYVTQYDDERIVEDP